MTLVRAPGYELRVEGTRLEQDIMSKVSDLRYDDNMELAPVLEFTVNDRYHELLDAKVFAEGNWIELWGGYGTDYHFMDRLLISSPPLPDFPDSGLPTMNIRAYGALQQMIDQHKKPPVPRFKKASDAVRFIAEKRYEFTTDIDDTKIIEKPLFRKGMTDFEFVKRLAVRHGYWFWIDHQLAGTSKVDPVPVFHFVRKDLPLNQRFEFRYGRRNNDALLSFTPEYAAVDLATDIEILTFERGKRRAVKGEKKEEKKGDSTKFVGSAGTKKIYKDIKKPTELVFTALGGRHTAIARTTFRNEALAKRFAEEWMKENKRNFLLGTGRVVGHPLIKARTVHELSGIGERLLGEWEFTSTSHRWPSGDLYIIDFTARKVIEEG